MFVITIQAVRLWIANFSFNDRANRGHRIVSMEASTGTTNVVPMSSIIALFVSAGLHIALINAGIVGWMSGFVLVLQTAVNAFLALLLTCAFVSHTWFVNAGINVGIDVYRNHRQTLSNQKSNQVQIYNSEHCIFAERKNMYGYSGDVHDTIV
jgi:hypothetical protein